jgi:hypothetical protein
MSNCSPRNSIIPELSNCSPEDPITLEMSNRSSLNSIIPDGNNRSPRGSIATYEIQSNRTRRGSISKNVPDRDLHRSSIGGINIGDDLPNKNAHGSIGTAIDTRVSLNCASQEKRTLRAGYSIQEFRRSSADQGLFYILCYDSRNA